MNEGNTRLCFATVLVQALWAFLVVTLILALPTLWRETYTARFGDKLMPALTVWMLDICPQDWIGVLCLGIIVAVTHACVGAALVVTAPSPLDALQRT